MGSDTEVHGFDNNVAANTITLGRMDGFWSAAENAAKTVSLSRYLSGCPSTGAASCFVEAFGRRAFRRPLSAEEKADYISLFNQGASREAGARYVVQTMLVSPNFLYRTELGQNGQLTQYEIASLLAYTFWGSTPDDSLLDKAANNQLAAKEQLKQTVDGLLKTPRPNSNSPILAASGCGWSRLPAWRGMPVYSPILIGKSPTIWIPN